MQLKVKIVVMVTVLACAAVVFWRTAGNRQPLPTLTYSRFVDQVRSGRVVSTVIEGRNSVASEATYRLKDGSTGRIILPSHYRDILAIMQDNHVDVEIAAARSGITDVLMPAIPFILLLAFWVFLMMRFRTASPNLP